MNEIETRMRAEETEYLQEKIRTNALLEEPAAIAKKILIERGAEVPVPETESELEDKVKSNMHLSTLSAITVCTFLAISYYFEAKGVKLLFFSVALIGVLFYLNSQKRR